MPKRGRPSGSHDIAPQIRGAFKRAAMQLEDEGRPLSTMIKESLEEDFLGTLRAIQGFLPRETRMDLNVQQTSLLDILIGISEQSKAIDQVVSPEVV